MNNYSMPKVSIVMVCYNAEKYIQAAIDSVVSQKYKNIEFIIVDGNSNDGTVSIIERNMDSVSKFISEPDDGQSDAFIKAFNLCTGDWLTWLNADDILMDGAIQTLVDAAHMHSDIDCFTGNVIWADEKLNVINCRKGEPWFSILPQMGYLNVYGPTTFFKRKLYDSVNGIDKRLHYQMDTDLWFQFFNKGARFLRLKTYIWVLRVHDEAKTTAQYFDSDANVEKFKAKMKEEREYIYRKNGVKPIKLGKIVLLFRRLCSINYIFSIIESVFYKGKNYKRLG
ncbi:glycosyltransferase family 2 protein [Vibrio breoganii]